jgi:hypothetical protein
VLYNFHIQSTVWFYSNFWSFSLSNRATLKQFRRQNATSRASRARARRACAVPSSASGPLAPSQGPRAPKHLEVRTPRARPPFTPDRPATRCASAGPSAAPLCAHLPRSLPYHGRNLRCSLRHEARESRLFKRPPPLARGHAVDAPPLEPLVEQHPPSLHRLRPLLEELV